MHRAAPSRRSYPYPARRRTNELARLGNRRDQYWWQWLDVDNTGQPVYSTNIITATLAQGTNSLVARQTKQIFTPREPERFEHDADGNLTRDGRFDYEWNANNRLIAVESRPTVPEHARTRLEFDYDHQGRRTRKTVLSECVGGAYTATSICTFVYDGWNVIAEIRDTGAEITTNTYLCGKDLSGSLQGAGGIGGLLSLSRSAQVERRVSDGLDDAEQQTAGSMYLNSTDLELLYDGATEQTVGMRFRSIAIPRGATITKAYVRFQVDEPDSAPTTVTIHGEDADDADAFSSATSNITARPLTTASVSWTVPAWVTPGEAGSDQQTEDISEIIQQIVDRDGWRSGNAMALIFSGSGERTAEAYEGDPSAAPLLHIEYCTDNFFYLYDGNGNIMALVNATDGSLAAEYEYGPFGEPLKATGPAAQEQSFRFSSKYTDPESGLVYYGFRHYCAGTGRWASRDPIGEEDNVDLYTFVLNASTVDVDVLGLERLVRTVISETYRRKLPRKLRRQSEYLLHEWFKCRCIYLILDTVDEIRSTQDITYRWKIAVPGKLPTLERHFKNMLEALPVVGDVVDGVNDARDLIEGQKGFSLPPNVTFEGLAVEKPVERYSQELFRWIRGWTVRSAKTIGLCPTIPDQPDGEVDDSPRQRAAYEMVRKFYIETRLQSVAEEIRLYKDGL